MFAERLKELRLERGLTQKELASQIDTSQQNIGHWERGKQLPKHIPLQRLADFFDVSTNYLLGTSDSRTPDTIVSGNNNTINGTVSGDISGNITINNTTSNPVPVTLKNTEPIFESQKEDILIQKQLLEVQKEILAELKKLNKSK